MNNRKKTQMQGEDEVMLDIGGWRDTVNYHYAMNSIFVIRAPKMLKKGSNNNHETFPQLTSMRPGPYTVAAATASLLLNV